MMNRTFLMVVLLLGSTVSIQGFCETPAMEFWNAYDAESEPLDTEIIEQWEDAAGMYQLVRYRLGTLRGSNKTASPIIAAYYGYPKDASTTSPVPGIVHIHGGGQRAEQRRVADWVNLGFAAVSINWGGKALERSNGSGTDWDGIAAGFERPGASGADDLIHHNVVSGGANSLFKEPHPMNSSWTLIAMCARRALTFLQSQPQVDGDKLGVEGHSMGGRGTVLTAIDRRVKAASPSVGGSGFLYQDMWGLPGSARRMAEEDGPDLYRRLVSMQSYWPHIEAPILFLQASNDFNAPMDLVVNGMSLLPEQTERMTAIAPHLNHRFTTQTSAARFMWMEAHLKESFVFPKQSRSALKLDMPDHVPRFEVSVDRSSGLDVNSVEVYYGYARDPRIRFWRSAIVEQVGNAYSARCPVFDIGEPLFVFSNITYRLPSTLPARVGAEATNLLTVSSQYQRAYPSELDASGVVATEGTNRVVDDFQHDWRDWYRLNAKNPHHWFYATRKIVDPSWIGPVNGKLAFEIVTSEPGNRVAVGIETNAWQGYTGRKRDRYHAFVECPSAGEHSIVLAASDFHNDAGQPMRDWDESTELFFTPANRVSTEVTGHWHGPPPRLKELRWKEGSYTPRAYPHQARGATMSRGASFRNEFRQAIDDSVAQEVMDDRERREVPGGRIYLTHELATSSDSFLRVHDDKGWSGQPLRVGGKQYERGLGVHADSKITFTLDGRFERFHVIPGPDDAHRGDMDFRIVVDGRQVFTTGTTRSNGGKTHGPVEIDVLGAKQLTLIVDSLGDRGGDHACWADAYLVKIAEITAP
ncbi:MAG: NPCBM/NEW2 domain-containing protein [Rubripirellula sp.]